MQYLTQIFTYAIIRKSFRNRLQKNRPHPATFAKKEEMLYE
jgi:hypothetical protein